MEHQENSVKVTQDEVAAAMAEPDEPTEGLIGGFTWPTSFADPKEQQAAAQKPSEPAHGTVHPEQAAVVTDAKAPLFKGLTKNVNTHEELAAYATELERKVIEHEAKLSVYSEKSPAVASPAVEAKPAKKYAEKMFVDPEGTLNELRADILSELDQKNQREQRDRTFWDSFRTENPDLHGAEEIVDLMLAKNRQTWEQAKLPTDQVRKLLATESRNYVKRIVDSRKPTDTLPGGRVAVLPASGNTPPRVEVVEAPKSFADQIRSLRKGKKRVG